MVYVDRACCYLYMYVIVIVLIFNMNSEMYLSAGEYAKAILIMFDNKQSQQ